MQRSESQLALNPSDRPFAEGKITSAALDKPVVFNDQTMGVFREQVLAALPSGAQHMKVIREDQNAVLLNNNPVIELVVAYDAFGQSFQRSVMLVNTPANQIRFQFTARKADFDALYCAFRGSVVSWEWQPEPHEAEPETNA